MQKKSVVFEVTMHTIWDDITQITDVLFVCGFHAINDQELKDNKINLIVNATPNIENYQSSDKNVKVVRVPVVDTPTASLAPYFKVRFFIFEIVILC